MAIRWNWIQTASGTPTYSAQNDRDLIDSLYDEGTLRGLKVTANGSTRSVDVASGRAVVQGDDTAGQNVYLVTNTASANVAIPAAPGSGSTIHLVGFQVNDPSAGGAGTKDVTLVVVSGTSGAGSRPATPNSFLELAQVQVNAGDALVNSARVTDTRVFAGPKQAVGTVIQWYGSSARVPKGWAIMDGGVLGAYTSYPDLADLLGITSGNITLPDARERALVGVKSGSSFAGSVGASGGESAHTITLAEMPSHTHSVTDPGHAHSLAQLSAPYGNPPGGAYNLLVASLTPVGATATAATGIQLGATGSGQAHNNLQPYIAVHHLLRVL